MKTRLTIFFIVHFFIVLTLAAYLTITTYVNVHERRHPNVPVLGFLKEKVYDNKYFNNYLVFSGINTGYGFYGIRTAMENTLTIELYDSSKKFIKEDAFFNFSTTSGFSRFQGFAAHLASQLGDIEVLVKDSSAAAKQFVKFRGMYVEKVFKWLGRKIARETAGCAYYKIKLNTVVPVDIWRDSMETPKIYVIKEMEFAAR